MGRPAVRREGVVKEISGRRQALLLTLLALRPGAPIDTGHLVDALWEDGPPADPSNALQCQVSRLRLAIGEPVLFRSGTYELAVPRTAVDVWLFEDLVREARQLIDGGAHVLGRRRVEQALDLWRGVPFPELADIESLRAEVDRLEELRLEALVLRILADVGLRRYPSAVRSLRTLTAAYPLREDLWALLVRTLYAAGRTADALATYRSARSVLVRELGLEPGPLLAGLEDAMLRRDPRLVRGGLDVTPPAPWTDEGGRQQRAHAHALAHALASTPRPLRRLADTRAMTELFVERVTGADPTYAPDADEVTEIARLCAALGGDPVAVEHAAARVVGGR